jgi:8-oxo-dGTP pyrophosphatase MutT (NUDIX family)
MSTSGQTAEELLDYVDGEDNVIDQMTRDQYYALATPPGYLRAVELLLVNDEGKLWIPRRTKTKRIAPDCLDYSSGGHVDAGETYMQACLRETEEELSLKLQPSDLEFIMKFSPTPEVPYFRKLFVYRTNMEPAFNPEDFASAEWIEPQLLVERIKGGEKAKDSMLVTIEGYIKAVGG